MAQTRATLIATMSEICPLLGACVHSPELVSEFCGGLNNAVRKPLEELSKALIQDLKLEEGSDDEDMLERVEIRYFREAIMGSPATALGVNQGLVDGNSALLESFFDTYPLVEKRLMEMLTPGGSCVKCLKEANRQWCLRHPTDEEYPPHPCEKQPVPIVDAEDRVKMILELNLKLHYNDPSVWEPLLASRDSILRTSDTFLADDKLPSEFRTALYCLKASISSLRPHFSPYEVWDTLVSRLTRIIEVVERFHENVEQEKKRRHASSGGILSRMLGSLRRQKKSDESFDKVSTPPSF
eukprot:TRINITY_DN1126_c0_g2_i2.p1 TRINITY_DN1126_c0_g2~~TRINITY_DN1126_c0_g2_i2.p1  ORF type:complete len:307 (+),score=52.65 TRINITY_DN1126_c0_g2_i2:32-922(+)